LLDVLTKYAILVFFRLGLNRLKFYRTKTWDIMTKNQISADSNILISGFQVAFSLPKYSRVKIGPAFMWFLQRKLGV
jgi:hypothetical protein